MVNQDLHISERLKAILPGLTDEEKTQLKANIVADGRVTDPVLYWWDGKRNVVVDGMHRYPVAKREGIPFHAELIEIGETYEDAELWILNRQLGRRNLMSPQVQRRLVGELYNHLKGPRGGDHKSEKSNCQSDSLIGDAAIGDAAKETADKAKVSPATAVRSGALVDALAECIPGVKKGIDAGAFKIPDADIKILSKLPKEDQNTITNDLRKDLAKTVKESMKRHKIKAPAPPKKPNKPPAKTLSGPEKKASDAKYQIKIWSDSVGRWFVSIDGYRAEYPGKQGDLVIERAKQLYEAMNSWAKVIR